MAKYEPVQAIAPKSAPDREVRVLIGAPDTEPHSLWVRLHATEDGFAVRFVENYGVTPAPGWTLSGRDAALVVVSVESGVMNCRKA